MRMLALSRLIVSSLFGITSGAVKGETINFDRDQVGSLPADWVAGVTGRGTPQWSIEADATAPSPPNVLKQSGSGTFPWCVKRDASFADGSVEVKFKPIAGRED